MNDNPNINVSIQIDGDVSNAEIVGVRIEQANSKPKTLAGNLFKYIFTEYLGLPALCEIQSRLTVRQLMREGRSIECQSVHKLWQLVLGRARDDSVAVPSRDPVAVRLQNVQLTSFVNRSPGNLPGTGLARFSARDSVGPQRHELLVGTDVLMWEDLVVRQFGLGDVRFDAFDDRYLLAVLDRPPSLSDDFFHVAHTDWFREPHLNFMRGLDDDKAWITAYGFPVVVTALAYSSVIRELEAYGAVRLEGITGVLASLPSDISLDLPVGIPKLALLVDDRSALQGVSPPDRSLASAWTVVTTQSNDQYQFAHWPFVIGTPDYRINLSDAVKTINKEISRFDLQPIFEFDASQNWFSSDAPFGPRTIRALYHSLQEKERLLAQNRLHDFALRFQAAFDRALVGAALGRSAELGHSRVWEMSLHEAYVMCCEGLAQLRFGKTDRAIQLFDAISTRNPDYCWAYFFRGACLYFQGEHSKAAVALGDAVDRALDELLQGSGELLRSPSSSYAEWYVLMLLWLDYVERTLGQQPQMAYSFVPSAVSDFDPDIAVPSDSQAWEIPF